MRTISETVKNLQANNKLRQVYLSMVEFQYFLNNYCYSGVQVSMLQLYHYDTLNKFSNYIYDLI